MTSVITKNERDQLKALSRCRFGPYRLFDKRFVEDVGRKARRNPDYALTREQQFALAKIVYRYRKQLRRHLPDSLIITTKPTPDQFGLADKEQTVTDLFTGESSPPHEVNIDEKADIHQLTLI